MTIRVRPRSDLLINPRSPPQLFDNSPMILTPCPPAPTQNQRLTEPEVGSAVGADDRRVKAGLKRFKAFIEERGTESGAWSGQVDRP